MWHLVLRDTLRRTPDASFLIHVESHLASLQRAADPCFFQSHRTLESNVQFFQGSKTTRERLQTRMVLTILHLTPSLNLTPHLDMRRLCCAIRRQAALDEGEPDGE